jgi:hypothetical protein
MSQLLQPLPNFFEFVYFVTDVPACDFLMHFKNGVGQFLVFLDATEDGVDLLENDGLCVLGSLRKSLRGVAGRVYVGRGEGSRLGGLLLSFLWLSGGE